MTAALRRRGLHPVSSQTLTGMSLCLRCGAPCAAVRKYGGRPATFCSATCKQRTYERRALYRIIAARVMDDVLTAATATAAAQRSRDWALRRTRTR